MNTINARTAAPAEGEDVGNGTSQDYIIPDAAPEDIRPESDVPIEKTKPGMPPAPPETTPATEAKPEPKEEKKGGFLRGLFRKKKKSQDDKNESPKAVMPDGDHRTGP